MRWKPSELIAGGCALLIAFGADAGVRRFAMTTDPSSNSEGEIELEGWLDFGRPANAAHRTDTSVTNGMFWLGLRLGLLDNLELSSFLVLEKKTFVELQKEPTTLPDGTVVPPKDVNGTALISEDQSGIMMWVSELKWRPVEVGKWPVDLFLQFQLVHWFERYHPTQFRFTLGLAKTISRVMLAANISYWDSVVGTSLNSANTVGIRWAWWEFSVGASVNVKEADGWVPSVSTGIELWGFIPRDQGEPKLHVHNHLLHGGGLVLGPNVSLARGRLWLTAHLGFPIFVPIFDSKGESSRAGPDPFPMVGRITLGITI